MNDHVHIEESHIRSPVRTGSSSITIVRQILSPAPHGSRDTHDLPWIRQCFPPLDAPQARGRPPSPSSLTPVAATGNSLISSSCRLTYEFKYNSVHAGVPANGEMLEFSLKQNSEPANLKKNQSNWQSSQNYQIEMETSKLYRSEKKVRQIFK
ncbi:hypothetical protein EVAR_45557_1 [Eumeta japonica]|uniref:Uncharacterized protein n=1 Tax=Eumeta variegata TaxID=151549 RepID=A0A4C1XAS7_EUMVA|nr:hypothetical protein EVAR_45557_1 [Eumeta japonica]